LRKGLYETADALSPWSSKESRRILVFVPPMRKEAEEFTGRSKEIIEIKSRAKATIRSHVFFHLGPGISPHVPATNVAVVGRDSPPLTAATISSKDTRWNRGKQCWRASCGPYLLPCWLTKGIDEAEDAKYVQARNGGECCALYHVEP